MDKSVGNWHEDVSIIELLYLLTDTRVSGGMPPTQRVRERRLTGQCQLGVTINTSKWPLTIGNGNEPLIPQPKSNTANLLTFQDADGDGDDDSVERQQNTHHKLLSIAVGLLGDARKSKAKVTLI